MILLSSTSPYSQALKSNITVLMFAIQLRDTATVVFIKSFKL